MQNIILLKNGLIDLPRPGSKSASKVVLGTIVANLIRYGFALNETAYKVLESVDDATLKTWWPKIEPDLKKVTGDDKQMDKFVVYKNFPAETLAMSEAEYWIKQIFMYWGAPNELFTQEEKVRDSMLEKLKLKTLQPAKKDSLNGIFKSLVSLPARWTTEQTEFTHFLLQNGYGQLDVKQIPFKENMVDLTVLALDNGLDVKLSSATDILRLGVALSGGDITMVTNTPFVSFSRPRRRALLAMLNKSTNLEEDVARDTERWKRFLKALRPGDYKFKKVSKVYDRLYKDKAESFNVGIEAKLLAGDVKVLKDLSGRPGEYMRRLHKLISLFGTDAVKGFVKVAPRLKVSQLLKIRGYINTINGRTNLAVAPKGNWTKLQVLENKKEALSNTEIKQLNAGIDKALQKKLAPLLKKGVALDAATVDVKLQTNDSDLLPYGRGTVLHIPSEVKFIRSASYWKAKGHGNVWYDNGWNFFDENWKDVGALCWTNVNYNNGAAIFSGDPTSSKDVEGRACQMIDLYIDKLAASGVRYAVWNLLCFSGLAFNECDVFGAIQWGEDAQKGKLFEPARAQMVFPIKGENKTKYIAYLDVKERKVVYLDANLRGSTQSAANNGKTLSEQMPALVEYLSSLPSVHDLFKNAKQSKNGMKVVYHDDQVSLKKEEPAYVFKGVNDKNSFKQVNVGTYLNA